MNILYWVVGRIFASQMTHTADTRESQSLSTLIIIVTSILARTFNYNYNPLQSQRQDERNKEKSCVPEAKLERAAAEEEETAHHGDERDGLDGGDDAPERGVQEEGHVADELGPPLRRRAHMLGPRPLLRLPPPLERGRRGEQRGQAGQAEVRRPPEHGHQAAAAHGSGRRRPLGTLLFLSSSVAARVGRAVAVACGVAGCLVARGDVACLFVWFDSLVATGMPMV
jgi:hypothetical protein